jgi:hypothetical protein
LALDAINRLPPAVGYGSEPLADSVGQVVWQPFWQPLRFLSAYAPQRVAAATGAAMSVDRIRSSGSDRPEEATTKWVGGLGLMLKYNPGEWLEGASRRAVYLATFGY